MIDLTEHSGGNHIPLKDIAKRQEISLKYLEGIMTDLAKSGLLLVQHGKGGGYKLNGAANDISVWKILLAAEGDMTPIPCLEETAKPCMRAAECRTLPVWEKLYDLIRDYFEGITLADLAISDPDSEGDNYVI